MNIVLQTLIFEYSTDLLYCYTKCSSKTYCLCHYSLCHYNFKNKTILDGKCYVCTCPPVNLGTFDVRALQLDFKQFCDKYK